jgi:hypothetical protein
MDFEKLYVEVVNQMAKIETENDELKSRILKCSKCNIKSKEEQKNELEKRKAKAIQRKTNQKILEKEIEELKKKNETLKTDFENVKSTFFFSTQKPQIKNKPIVIQNENPYCDDCEQYFTQQEGRLICLGCGSFQENSYFVDSLTKDKRKSSSYNKLKYFSVFLQKIQDKSSFPLDKLKPLIDNLFKKKSFTSMADIKNTLYEKKQTKTLLRYSIEIFFYLNTYIKPLTLTNSEIQSMIKLYAKVIKYEKINKIKLSQSKTYFTMQFCMRYAPEKIETLKLLTIEKLFLGNKVEYEKCLKEILSQ